MFALNVILALAVSMMVPIIVVELILFREEDQRKKQNGSSSLRRLEDAVYQVARSVDATTVNGIRIGETSPDGREIYLYGRRVLMVSKKESPFPRGHAVVAVPAYGARGPKGW